MKAHILWLRLCLCLSSVFIGCSSRQVEGDSTEEKGDGGGGGGGDRIHVNAAGCRGVFCDDAAPCGAGRRCVQSVCFQDQGTCASDNECQNDTRCHMGACIPWDACDKLTPYDPNCMGQVFTPEEFKAPTTSCKLEGFSSLSLPVVADLDKDGKPEIITIAYGNIIIAVRGDDCRERFRKTYPSLLSSGQGSVAVADLDGDGFGEIVAVTGDQRVMVLDRDGNVLATSPTPAQEQSTYGQQLWSAPTIADVDGAAPPEIIIGAQVSRFSRLPTPRIEVLWTKPNKSAWWGSIPIVADLDGDGKPEVISSDRIYEGATGVDKTPAALPSKPFYAQVADFNMDKKPDLLLIHSERSKQQISIYDYANGKTIYGPQGVAEGGWGGPAVIADFDGDKVPDFGLASANAYYVYALKCLQSPRPADCKGSDPGVLWSKPTTDRSSGGTGSSVFDFNGDGVAEVVYRDECWLRVYNGPNGKTLFAANVTSNTCLELPVIADVNNDGHADIVVTSDALGACPNRGPEPETGTPWVAMTSGVHVLRDPMNRWMPSRPLWNQHSYHITNINDDLSVPAREADNWLTYNNYRQNVQGGPMGTGSLPDGTGKQVPGLDSPMCSAAWRQSGQICNRGAGPLPAPIYGTFYDGHPAMGGKVICTAQTQGALMPGQCEGVSCVWTMPPAGPRDIWFRVGDDGKGGMRGGQCKSGNKLSVLRGATCGSTPG